MGFSQTKTTVLKSVGDMILIVSLVLGGIVTLNIKNGESAYTRLVSDILTIHNLCSAARNSDGCKHHLHRSRSLHRVSSTRAGLDASCRLLVYKLSIGRIYCWVRSRLKLLVRPSIIPPHNLFFLAAWS